MDIYIAVSHPMRNVANKCLICGRVIACKANTRTLHGRMHVREGSAWEEPPKGIHVNGRESNEPTFYPTAGVIQQVPGKGFRIVKPGAPDRWS